MGWIDDDFRQFCVGYDANLPRGEELFFFFGLTAQFRIDHNIEPNRFHPIPFSLRGVQYVFEALPRNSFLIKFKIQT